MGIIGRGPDIDALVDKIVDTHNARREQGFETPTGVVFSGGIGAGKSTTIKIVYEALKEHGLKVGIVPEQLPKNLFPLYLSNPKKYGWTFQIAMANLRAYDAYDAWASDVDVLLFDRYIGEDRVFFLANVASGTIDLVEHPEYQTIYDNITLHAETYFQSRCALFVNVHTPFEKTVEHMCNRNREGEKDAYSNNPYFRTVFDMREEWLEAQNKVWGERMFTFDNTAHSPLHVSACDYNPEIIVTN